MELALYDTKYARFIIICIKYLIKLCKPYLKALTSHTIESAIMEIIFEEPRYFKYDSRRQVEETFLECFKRLEDMIKKGFIPDIIFRGVNGMGGRNC